jgi:hypothetical protein
MSADGPTNATFTADRSIHFAQCLRLPVGAGNMATVTLRLVGVYNADGSLRGELAYLVGRARGSAHCALCDVTHGRLRRRADFDEACARLPVPLELRHRNEIDRSMVDLIGGRYPCVLVVDPDPEVLLGPDDVDACGGAPGVLVARITEALAARA